MEVVVFFFLKKGKKTFYRESFSFYLLIDIKKVWNNVICKHLDCGPLRKVGAKRISENLH